MQERGVIGGAVPDGHRTLELGDRRPECVGRGEAVRTVAVDECGDDLCVGGDGVREAQVVAGTKVDVVVDVAVQHRDGHERVRAADLLAVHRMGIRFADDPDTRPPRVAEDCDPRTGHGDSSAKDVVGGDGSTHVAGVVAELPDLRGCLVDEHEVPGCGPHAVVREQRVAGAGGHLFRPLRRDR